MRGNEILPLFVVICMGNGDGRALVPVVLHPLQYGVSNLGRVYCLGLSNLLKHFPNLHPMNETCVLNPPFFCVKHVLGGV